MARADQKRKLLYDRVHCVDRVAEAGQCSRRKRTDTGTYVGRLGRTLGACAAEK